MVQNRLPILILLLLLIYLFVIPEEPANFKFVFSFVPLILIIVYGFRILPKRKTAVHLFILLGLIISLISGFLSQWFLFSLITFAIVSLCYLSGFFSVKVQKQTNFLVLLLPIVLYAGMMITLIYLAANETESQAKLLPSILFILVLASLLWSAGRTRHLYAISGSLLFVIAHSLFLYASVSEPISYLEEVSILCYYTGQLLIATSLGTIVRDANRITW